MKIEFIVLAAGKGKRTKSELPKVILPLGGEPMLFSILHTLANFNNAKINLVVGKGAKQVKASVNALAGPGSKLYSKLGKKIKYVEQKEQRGTGHAVAQAFKRISNDNNAIAVVLYGDVPLLQQDTIKRIIAATQGGEIGPTTAKATRNIEASAVWLVANLANPTGYGRIVRNALGNPRAIVEEKDCDSAQREIREINTGILAAPVPAMKKWLKTLLANPPQNNQGEYLLTDLMELACRDDHNVKVLQAKDMQEIQGANDMWQLAQLERTLQQRRVKALALQGVYFQDPARIDILGEVKVASGVRIGANVVFKGKVKLGADVVIGNNCILEDTSIAAATSVHDFCHIKDSKIGARCSVGPYVRLRPGSLLAEDAHIGNFVEIKKSKIGKGTKASHLSYIGDSIIGKNSNIGAGLITCNYDGKNKHQTVIGNDAFIGSNSSLVAPVKIGNNAIVGAGSVITKNVAKESLAVTRAPQRTLENYVENQANKTKSINKAGKKKSQRKKK